MGKYVDYISEWDKRFDLLIDRDATAAPDQAEASDHTYRVENVAPIVAEAGSINDVADVASLEETVVLQDNQDPENDVASLEETVVLEDNQDPENANAAPDQAEAPDHTDRVENVALIVAEAGSVNAVADVACSEETVIVVDNQDLEIGSCPFVEEVRRAEASLFAELSKENEKLKEEARRAKASLIAELRKENEKLKAEARRAEASLIAKLRKENENLKEEARQVEALLIAEQRKENKKLKEEFKIYDNNFPKHVKRESLADSMENNALNYRVDNVDVDHQSPAGDTTSSRDRNSTKNRSCHPQIEAMKVKKQRVSHSPPTNSTAGVGIVDRAEPVLIIDVDSDSDSDSDDGSITDSYMDALVGRIKKS